MKLPELALSAVQKSPELLLSADLTTLAWLMHEAEWKEDDQTFQRIDNVMHGQQRHDLIEEYRRLWPHHAIFRGYGNCSVDIWPHDGGDR